ncbi:ABC transporter permease [Thalassotalea sp. 1_MG-2023]|uniref:ABC transporter permease n=1 Tax=Thalassotalea sp. 1_MG-2023 TaxID=3062680 RepID=UPI0026E188FA|nr:ABC transporter permease [Thalassotalea sp. 1_MG-2023]MDO6425760.1 ABC transporter permease [Thalassotalea sp. 1_MG-2023]
MKPNKSKQVWLVTCWEFMHFFKWKQELISKLIMIAIAAMVYFWQVVKNDDVTIYQIALTSQSVVLQSSGQFKFEYVDSTALSAYELLQQEDSKYDAVIAIGPKIPSEQQQLILTVNDKQSWHSNLNTEILNQYRQTIAQQLNLQPNQLALLQTPVSISQEYADQAIKSDDEVSDTIAIVMIVLMAVGIFTSFGQLFASITGEKQQRVTEQLYSCISAQSWIDGKILGQLLHAIKAMITAGITGLLGYAFMAVVINEQSLDLAMIDWSFIPWLFIFSLLGIYISTAFIAAVAAAIDDPNHSAKTSMMLLPLVPVALVFMTMDDASGWAMSMLSFLPLTSFVAMPVKMSLIDVPLWHTLLSLVLGIALAAWLRSGAARMFKMGMTMYGKEPSVGMMFKWMIKEPK